ncbi:MAG: hypothetical protein N2663_08345 [Chlorobi bacterium]|nr:hypothetical protein [Chlorobiota bacterium]
MAVFAGWTYSSLPLSIALVLSTMLTSDIALALINNEAGYLFHGMLPVVYGTFVFIVGISRYIAKHRRSVVRIIGSLLLGSTVFFVVTNFFVWLLSSMYPRTLDGLMMCYAMAVPFYHVNGLEPFSLVRNALLGDGLYGALLFGLYAFAKWKFSLAEPASSPTIP